MSPLGAGGTAPVALTSPDETLTITPVPGGYELETAGTAGFVLIEKQLLAVTTSPVVFSAIPDKFSHLRLVALVQSVSTSEDARDTGITLNGDAGGNYNFEQQVAVGASVSSAAALGASAITLTQAALCPAGPSPPTAGAAGGLTIDLPGYSSTTFLKSVLATNGWADPNIDLGGGEGLLVTTVASWLSTAAIDEITLTDGGGGYAAGSIFCLYGLA